MRQCKVQVVRLLAMLQAVPRIWFGLWGELHFLDHLCSARLRHLLISDLDGAVVHFLRAKVYVEFV